ncbi:MAG: hypothetical protein IJ685_02630 [Selenomonadaceae bacterium]|nr:hypothetical protein [Selenomonadaceae bacterium]
MQNVPKKIIEIIMANFPNGIRDDFIDTNKVLRIYSTDYVDEKISRELIADVIRENGIEFGSRFYFLAERDREIIFLIADELLEQYPVVYYSAVYDKHAEFFNRLHIFSPQVLKKILQETGNDYFCFDEFCSASKLTRLDHEVSKIFMAAEKSLSLEDLQAKLPYVPPEKILAVINNAKKYLPTNTGKYFPVSKIKFDAEEIFATERQIFSRIDANGYAAPEDYDLSSNFALNPELSKKDLRNVIYQKFFSAEFTKRGKKIFKKSTVAEEKISTTTALLRQFISAQEELTAEKLFAFVENQKISRSGALSVAHEEMTRVEKKLFVKDSSVNFDVAKVDEALTPFVRGKIISLRSVTSFTGFPPVAGYSWNLFLLESFLRKHSEKYFYDAPGFNNANAGAIYPKAMKFKNYLDVQVAAVVQEKIPLEKFAVEYFLVEQGFRVNRIKKVTDEIIKQAQEISNR